MSHENAFNLWNLSPAASGVFFGAPYPCLWRVTLTRDLLGLENAHCTFFMHMKSVTLSCSLYTCPQGVPLAGYCASDLQWQPMRNEILEIWPVYGTV
jgi:hypothetical protein